MNRYLIPGLFIAAIALFFIGRWTAPAPADDRQHVIDSLNKVVETATILREAALQSMRLYKARADKLYAEAIENAKQKAQNKAIHENDVRRIDHYDPDELDSALLARYPDSLYRKDPVHP